MSVLLGPAKAYRALGVALAEEGDRASGDGHDRTAYFLRRLSAAHTKAASALDEQMKREASQPPPAIESPCAG